jgi:uncharacterized membrane protein
MSFAAIMFGCINSVHEIIKEVHIYQRERTVNLGFIPYIFSKIIILSIICLLQCALLLAIMSLAAQSAIHVASADYDYSYPGNADWLLP